MWTMLSTPSLEVNQVLSFTNNEVFDVNTYTPNSTLYNFTNISNSVDIRKIKNFKINMSNKKRIKFRQNISLLNIN